MLPRIGMPSLSDHALNCQLIGRFDVHIPVDGHSRKQLDGLRPIPGLIAVPQRDPQKESRLRVIAAHHGLSKELDAFGVVSPFLFHPRRRHEHDRVAWGDAPRFFNVLVTRTNVIEECSRRRSADERGRLKSGQSPFRGQRNRFAEAFPRFLDPCPFGAGT
jgi:hypothetical protein